MDPLAKSWLGHTRSPTRTWPAAARANVTFDLVDIDRATAYAAEDADLTLRLWLG